MPCFLFFNLKKQKLQESGCKLGQLFKFLHRKSSSHPQKSRLRQDSNRQLLPSPAPPPHHPKPSWAVGGVQEQDPPYPGSTAPPLFCCFYCVQDKPRQPKSRYPPPKGAATPQVPVKIHTVQFLFAQQKIRGAERKGKMSPWGRAPLPAEPRRSPALSDAKFHGWKQTRPSPTRRTDRRLAATGGGGAPSRIVLRRAAPFPGAVWGPAELREEAGLVSRSRAPGCGRTARAVGVRSPLLLLRRRRPRVRCSRWKTRCRCSPRRAGE